MWKALFQNLEIRSKSWLRLIDAPKNEYLWAEKYEREFGNVLGLQGEIAQSIASQIQVELTPQEKTRLTTNRSVNPEVYELYLKGMYHLNKYTPEGINLGLSYLHQAVKKDSTNALSQAGLALAYDIIAHTPSPPPEATVMARIYTKKALDLDDNLAEAHLALAMLKIYGDRNKSGAEQSFKRALELNPSLVMAHAHYAWFLEISGSIDDALLEMKQAQRLDPLSPVYHAWEGWMCSWEGFYDRAIKKAHESLELNPELPVALYVLGCGYAAKGMFEKAIEVHVKAGELGPDWKFGLGQTYALAGLIDEAHEVTAELEKQTKLWYAWGLAEIYAALGEKDEAFRSLENALVLGHPYMPWLMRNGNFKPLHDDPRFDDLVRRSSLAKINIY